MSNRWVFRRGQHRRSRGGLSVFASLAAVLLLVRFDAAIAATDNAPAQNDLSRQEAAILEREANAAAMAASTEGEAALERRDYPAAISHFSRAIELQGSNRSAASWDYELRGTAYKRSNDIAGALADYDRSILLNADSSPAYMSRGRLLAERGELVAALKDMDQAIRIYPSSHRYIQRGEVLERLKRTDDAIQSYTKAIAVAPENYRRLLETSTDENFKKVRLRDRDHDISLALISRANIYRDRGDFNKAMADYEAALAAWDQAAYAAYGNRGILFERRGDKVRALADYERAAALRPNDDWLKRAIERVR